jgi:biopolymer transport protein TolQ
MSHPSLFHYFFQADVIVKLVMLLLVMASLVSWIFIFQRVLFFKEVTKELKQFEKKFHQAHDLNILYAGIENQKHHLVGMSAIFYQGYKEFVHLKNQGTNTNDAIAAIRTAMQITSSKLQNQMERHLSFLGSIASVSPYVGLLGTVWGIMNALQALGQVKQASIGMVAPGISEALVATALGLFAAIPAAIAYNRFSSKVNDMYETYKCTQEEVLLSLRRQL